MYFPFFTLLYRDEGSGGGGSASGGTGGAGGQAGGGGSGGDSGGAGGEKSGGGGGADAGTGKAAGGGGTDKDIDYKAEHEKLTKEQEGLRKKLDELQKGNDTMAAKLGALKKLDDAITDDPLGLIKRVAKQHGIEFKIDDGDGGGPKPTKKLSEMTEDELKEYLDQREKASAERFKREAREEFKPELQLSHEHRMKEQYSDYDDHKEGRDNLRKMYFAGAITMDEILHNAVRGMNQAKILEAHELEVREKINKELAGKTGGSHGGGGSGGGDKQLPGSEIDLKHPNDIRYIRARKKLSRA